MRRWLLTIGTVGLLMIPFAAGAGDYGPASPNSGTTPPVAQTLVREGDFAIKLAAELDLGNPTNEAVAEDLLIKAGIAPTNGWLSDYPMTPQIIGQLQDSVSRAASRGALPMTADQAARGLSALAVQSGLATPAGGEGGTAPQTAQTPPVYPSNQQVINNYYYNTGPPIVTYYPPPVDYVYLYDWVPYPVWWFGFWFPGFYICHDFSTVVVYQSRPVVVSNHFIDRTTRTVVMVDPIGTTGSRGGRPETVLRTDHGGRYRTFGDLQKGVTIAGPSGNGRQGAAIGTMNGPYRSPEARQGAASIYSRSITRIPTPSLGTSDNRQGSRINSGGRPFGGANIPWFGGERNLLQPRDQQGAPARRDFGNAGGRQMIGPDRVFRNTSPLYSEQPRGSFRSMNGPGGEHQSSGTRAYTGQHHQDMRDPVNGSPGNSWGGGMCRGRC